MGEFDVRRRQTKKGVKYYSAKRRALYAQGDEIDPLTLFNLHGWTCGICLKPIDRRLRLPNWWAATIEHRVPLAKGGTHTWDNVISAHAKCNFDKADSLLGDFSGKLIA
jgi:5-methylcytosine-specific restriction endonuclease McrA